MKIFDTRKYKIINQYLISISLIIITAVICHLSIDFIGYHVVALILLLVVSFLAMIFDIFPVLITALLSALIWNFLFIPPTLTFNIGTPEDSLMFLMYFVIALINAVLTFNRREYERKLRDKEEKDKTIKLYNTILNSLSHELRTPISTIIAAIETIKHQETRLNGTNRNELLSEIEIAAFRLNRQVENLLNMSRLEAGVIQVKLDWCDLNELIFKVIKDFEDISAEHTIVFESNENLPLFKLDRGIIVQVLQNLIHNAFQHTQKGTTIKILVENKGNLCKITICDNGKGFPVKEMDLVFDKFYKISNSVSGGTGLGLSIVKGFIDALGGTIHLENNITGGAKFTILIPVQTSSTSELDYE